MRSGQGMFQLDAAGNVLKIIGLPGSKPVGEITVTKNLTIWSKFGSNIECGRVSAE
jgi:hypothetical protein